MLAKGTYLEDALAQINPAADRQTWCVHHVEHYIECLKDMADLKMITYRDGRRLAIDTTATSAELRDELRQGAAMMRWLEEWRYAPSGLPDLLKRARKEVEDWADDIVVKGKPSRDQLKIGAVFYAERLIEKFAIHPKLANSREGRWHALAQILFEAAGGRAKADKADLYDYIERRIDRDAEDEEVRQMFENICEH